VAQTATDQEPLDQIVRVIGADMVTEPPEDVILIARNMGVADFLTYDRTSLRGMMLEERSVTAHVAIVARAQGRR